MNRAVIRKIAADLKSRPLQVAILFAIVCSAAAMLTVAITLQRGVSNPWERLFVEAKGAHVWFTLRASEENAGILNEIGELAGVSGYVGPFPETGFPGARIASTPFFVEGMPAQRSEIAAPVVTQGRWYSEEPFEAVLDVTLARRLGVEVGDVIHPSGADLPVLVVGLALDPGVSYPAAYMTPDTMESLFPNETFSFRAGYRLHDPSDLTGFIREASAVMPEGTPFTIRTWQWFEDVGNESTKIQALFLGVFSVIALVAAIFLVVNSSSAQILSHYREIGLMKAVGFTPLQVAGMYLAEYVGLAVLASLSGALIGAAASPALLGRAAETLRTVPPSAFSPGLIAATCVGIAAIMAISVLSPSIRAGRTSAIDALGRRFGAKSARASRLASVSAWLRVPAVARFGIKDAFGNPIRATLLIAVVALAVAAATFELFGESIMAQVVESPNLAGEDPYHIQVTRNRVPATDAEAILSGIPGIRAYYTRAFPAALIDGSPVTPETEVVSGDYRSFVWSILEGRMMRDPGEAMIGSGLARQAGISSGDQLVMATPAGSFTVTVTGVFRQQADEGPTVLLDAETMAAAGLEVPEPVYYAVRVDKGVDRSAVVDAIWSASGGRFMVRDAGADLTDDLNEIRIVLASLTLLVVGIATTGILSTFLITVMERRWEFGVMKTLGMTPLQALYSVATGAIAIALAGLVVGVPAGLVLTSLLIRMVGSQLGTQLDYSTPAPQTFLLLVPVFAAVALVGALLPARRALAVKVTEVLRYE